MIIETACSFSPRKDPFHKCDAFVVFSKRYDGNTEQCREWYG